ncbi:hypothetical protein [Niastella populi]|uniref:Uncharacterized protein n=1 Tax=Niastella populi TaxID=550983 RepID=A0A1V9FL04_9BACT|nr:hypothetical protein [Niastella populi]OQP59059.1 hypothetical protein A4R26_21980 [Niastella populi]
MTDQELEILLKRKCNAFDLKQIAFNCLLQIFKDNSNNNDFLNGYTENEIKTIFERFEYQIDRRIGSAIIRTRIGLYLDDRDNVWLDNIEPIGYYELETDFNGEILDDWFVIEKEKYVSDIEIISHFQSMNQKLPPEYLRRNHIQYEFVAYISLVGTLFISKQFEGAGRFVKRAYSYLETISDNKFDKDYLKSSKRFLKLMSKYLVTNNLISESLKQELIENKNEG